MPQQSSNHTIVFAHGAWSDGSIWTRTLQPLAREGFHVHSAQLPLDSFEHDVAALTALLNQVKSPVTLVAHSYAGAVATAAGMHEKVATLAYVTAFAPDDNESVTTVASQHPGEVQLNLPQDENGFLWLDSAFASSIGQDVDEALIELMVAVQKPTHASVFGGMIENAAWRHKPCSYLLTTEDRGLSIQAQRIFADRMKARVEEVAASHFVVLSQPERVTDFVRRSVISSSC